MIDLRRHEQQDNLNDNDHSVTMECNACSLTSSGDTVSILTSAARMTDKRSVGLVDIDSD